MLKSLAPVTTLLISWLAGLSDPSTSRWINVLVIAAGVLLSSIGEVRFGWRGFIFQMIGTVAESSRLILIQWYLAVKVGKKVADEEAELGLSSDDEESEIGHGHDNARASSCDDQQGSRLPTHIRTAQDRVSGEDHRPQQDEASRATHPLAEAQAIAGMSPLVLLFYYAPACMGLNFLAANWTEIPDFKVEDLKHVGYGMLIISGAVAFLLNVASVCLVRSSPLFDLP